MLRWARGRSPLRRGFLSGWLLHWVVSTKQRKYRGGVRKLSRSQLRPAKSPKLTGVVSIVSSNRDVFSFRMRSGHTFRAMDDRRFQIRRIRNVTAPSFCNSRIQLAIVLVGVSTFTKRKVPNTSSAYAPTRKGMPPSSPGSTGNRSQLPHRAVPMTSRGVG